MDTIILILSLVLNIVLFILYLNYALKPTNKKPENPRIQSNEEFDILLSPNGQYVPTYKGKYLIIWDSGFADTISIISNKSVFTTKADALRFIDEWSNKKGIGFKSVGLN